MKVLSIVFAVFATTSLLRFGVEKSEWIAERVDMWVHSTSLISVEMFVIIIVFYILLYIPATLNYVHNHWPECHNNTLARLCRYGKRFGVLESVKREWVILRQVFHAIHFYSALNEIRVSTFCKWCKLPLPWEEEPWCLSCKQLHQERIFVWLLIARRFNLYRDLRLKIAHMIE